MLPPGDSSPARAPPGVGGWSCARPSPLRFPSRRGAAARPEGCGWEPGSRGVPGLLRTPGPSSPRHHRKPLSRGPAARGHGQGVGPELLKAGPGQSQVQAGEEHGRKPIRPAHHQAPAAGA